MRFPNREILPTLALAGPIILAELGWVTMGIADTMFIGGLGAEAIGAVGIGGTLFLSVAVFGMGMLYGLDCLASRAFGSGKVNECRQILFQALVVAVLISVPLTAIVIESGPVLRLAKVNPEIIRQTVPFSRAVAWSMPPLLFFTAYRRYLQAIGRVRIFVFLIVSANLVNVLADWALILGHFGFPALGVVGSGYATAVTYGYMAATLAVYSWWVDGTSSPCRPALDPDVFRLLIRLGGPAAIQMTLESGVFAVVTTLAGGFDPASLASHHVVQTVAGLSAMISVGLATAAAVRVGRACGRDDPNAATRAGWTALFLGGGFMAVCGLSFLLVPRAIIRLFTSDPTVLAVAPSLLAIAAAFQVFDGLQAAATGALRGLGDTPTSLLVSLLANWGLGIPSGYFLAFPCGMGIHGLWFGLSFGLIASGIILIREWNRRTLALSRTALSQPLDR